MFKSRCTGVACVLPFWLLLLFVLVVSIGGCVNLDKYDKLNKEDLLKLDREVSNFYYDSYEKLDDKKLSYNEQLFRSIRAIRHTNVLNQFDYTYTDEKTMRNSAGKQVSLERCLRQLEALDKYAQQAADSSYRQSGDETSIPLSAIDMLEASARPESGTLNGNFVWLGSYTSCQHARISYKHMHSHSWYNHQHHSSSFNSSDVGDGGGDDDIVGRYCVAHLRAKSWPKDDPYFGNRLTLKAGLCLPEVCHTNLYVDSQEVKHLIERLTKSNMIAPFNSDQYEVSYLYCTPDEDSPHRQWDLGTKLFVVFVAIWSLLLLYSNLKYQRRLKAMKKLSESIDIKMIVEQNLPTSAAKTTNSCAGEKTGEQMQNLKLPARDGDGLSSNDATPVPSDVEDDPDGDFHSIRPLLLGKRKDRRRNRRFESSRNPENLGPFDFVKAFAVKANIDFLFRRADFLNSKSQQSQNSISQSTISKVVHSTSPTIRRLSATNAALIKDLEKENCETNSGRKGKHRHLGASSGSGSSALEDQKTTKRESEQMDHQVGNNSSSKVKRVNIDVLDGIKVFATGYIIYGHTLMFFYGVISDIRFGSERMLDFTMIATINGLQVVGLFYIITGLLISYLAFSRQKVKQLVQPSFWIIVIIGRYLRLLPTYLLVFWFAKHVAPFTGSGPFWLEYRTDSQHPRGFCSNESWLTMFTMSAADVKIPYDCVPQSWYLSNDFRTLLVIPFYIIILALNTTAGYAAIISTMIFSAVKMTHIARDAYIDYKILLHWQPHVYNILADRLHGVYTNLSIRLSTYLLGVIVGHILYLHENGQIKRMPRWFKRFGLKAALLIGSILFMGAPLMACRSVNQFLPLPETLNSDTVVILMPMFKIIMELCICFTLLSLTTGGGFKWLTELLSSQPARVLSSISYGVFLVHIEVMYKTPVSKYESDYYFLFLYSAFFIVSSNIIAFFVHVLYEMPINNVLRYAFKKIFYSIVK